LKWLVNVWYGRPHRCGINPAPMGESLDGSWRITNRFNDLFINQFSRPQTHVIP
jgi:hypothetical protein